MSRQTPQTFTLAFEIYNKNGQIRVVTDLPLKRPPLGTVRKRMGLNPNPEVTVVPRLTRQLRRLLRAMVEREQDESDRVIPGMLIGDMEKIIATVYAAAKLNRGISIDTLMLELLEPVMRIAWCARAVAEEIGYSDGKDDTSLTGRKFIQMLVDAARMSKAAASKSAQQRTPRIAAAPESGHGFTD